MPATKQYSRIYFENYPSENTPLNATNLNKLDKGIDDMDNEIVTVKNNLTASDNLTFKFTKSGNQYGYKDLANNFVPFKTTHTDTYTYPSGSTGGTYDMGVNHQYRYVNASNVYTKGKTDAMFTLPAASKSGTNIQNTFAITGLTSGKRYLVVFAGGSRGTLNATVTGGSVVSNKQIPFYSNGDGGYGGRCFLIDATSSTLTFTQTESYGFDYYGFGYAVFEVPK